MRPISPALQARLNRFIPWMTFPAMVLIYSMDASRTAQGGDTTEFALVGTLGGVAHPPGYPLYSLLARLGAALPMGPPFFRVALVSVMCAAAAVVVIQRATLRVTGSLYAAIFASFAFALWRQPWRLAGVPEVFSLHALTSGLILLMSLRAAELRRPRDLAVLGLVCGLGLSNHLTTVLCFPLVAWAIVTAVRGSGSALTRLAPFAAMVMVGLLPYLELMWAARTAGPDAPVWGDTRTWAGLIHHMLRQDYGTFQLAVGEKAAPLRHIWQYLKSTPSDLGYVWLAAALCGIPLALRRRRGFALILLATVLISGVLFISRFNLPDDEMGRETESRFYLLPHLMLTPFVAFSVTWLYERLRAPIAGFVGQMALFVPFVLNMSAANWSADTRVERTLVTMVASVPQNGVLVGHGDVLLPGIRWVQHVLKIRPDVRYIDISLLPARWYFERLRHTCPECKLRYEPRVRSLQEIATTLAPLVPVAMPHVHVPPPQGQPVRVDPDGLLDRVVLASAPPTRLEDAEAMLDRETVEIGHQPPPVDCWSGQTYLALVVAWDDLGERYREAGRMDRAAECRARAASVLAGD